MMKRLALLIWFLLVMSIALQASAHRRYIVYVWEAPIVSVSTSVVDITPLQMDVPADIFLVAHCKIYTATNATTTGAQIGFRSTATTGLTNIATGHVLTWPTVAGKLTPISWSGTPVVLVAADTDSHTTGWVANELEFTYSATVAATIIPVFKSEVNVASGVTVQVGSYCEYTYQTGY